MFFSKFETMQFLLISTFIAFTFLASSEAGDNAQEALGRKDEICMKELGCFANTDDFFHILYRPINFLPNDRSVINTKLMLYTKKNLKEPDILLAHDPESITKSNINPEQPTKFIVHGYMDSELYGPWLWTMKDEFLHEDFNIIIVDWSGGNKGVYPQAASNARVVGAEIALMIKALQKYVGIKPEDCHIIGHSLGGHVAGYAGERLEKLGRITALDPAEPYFQHLPKTVRLDPDDADFVDVIHTDSVTIFLMGFGMSQMVGHVDFFPNNGRAQPGCVSSKVTSFFHKGFIEGGRRFIACNHQRSVDFMTDSINYVKRLPIGYECSNWETFLEGKCADCGTDMKKCAVMGYRADEYKQFRNSSIQRAFYLKTAGASPFWLYQYQVTVKLFKPRVSYKDPTGSMEIMLHGSIEDHIEALKNKDPHFYHGSRYQYLLTTPRELGDVKSITLKWFSDSKNPIKWVWKPALYIEYISIVPMIQREPSPRNMTGRVFCHDPNSALYPKVLTYFHRDDNCLKYL